MNDVPAEGGLDELELLQRQAGDASVVGVFDRAVLAIGGAQDAVDGGAMLLDFEMNRSCGSHDGYT